jgi:4-carboxymuconolactone decarboxylase
MMRPAAAVPFNGNQIPEKDSTPGHVGRPGPKRGGGKVPLDYTDLLRRLSFNDEGAVADVPGGVATPFPRPGPILDARTLALVRLAALVAVGGAVPSYGAQADAAVDAGATAAEIVDVLVGVIPVVGLPCVVAAAPKLALALGHDVNDVI